jgi:hypothetical protein
LLPAKTFQKCVKIKKTNVETGGGFEPPPVFFLPQGKVFGNARLEGKSLPKPHFLIFQIVRQ